jgi:hypothetical protein
MSTPEMKILAMGCEDACKGINWTSSMIRYLDNPLAKIIAIIV